MARNLDDPGWVEVQKRVAEALAPFAPDFGARTCDHEEDWGDCMDPDCGFDRSRAKPLAMPVVQHFLLLVATTDMNDPSGTQPVQVAVDTLGAPGYVARGLANDFLSS